MITEDQAKAAVNEIIDLLDKHETMDAEGFTKVMISVVVGHFAALAEINEDADLFKLLMASFIARAIGVSGIVHNEVVDTVAKNIGEAKDGV